jgi:hypothetical protein
VRKLSIVAMAVLASLALSAAWGSASASATVLCKVAVSPCPAGSTYPKETAIAYGGYNSPGEFTLKFTNSTSKFTCGDSVVSSLTKEESGSPLRARGFGLIGSCKINGGEQCSSQSWNETENELTAFGGAGQGGTYIGSKSSPIRVSFKCKWPILNLTVECTYSANSATFLFMVLKEGEYSSWFEEGMTLTSGPGTCPGGGTARFVGPLGTSTYID